MRFLVTIGAALLLATATPVRAADDQLLPAFNVQTPDGVQVRSDAMTGELKWLLVYVNTGCRSCDTLVHALPRWNSAALLSRVVLVVGGSPTNAGKWIAKMLPPEMATLRWYADAGGEAFKALALPGAPVLIGVQGNQVEWQVAGVLNDPEALESVVRSWVENR